jgi:aminopeptidase N
LWAALEEGSGVPVNTLMHSWTKQQGYPVVSVKLKDGKLELEQVGHGYPQNSFRLYVFLSDFRIKIVILVEAS